MSSQHGQGFFVRVKSGRIPSFVGYSSDIARMGPNPNFRIGFIRRSYENFVPRSNRARMKVRTKLFVWNREVRMNRYFGTSPHTSSVRALSDICRMSDVWSSYRHRMYYLLSSYWWNELKFNKIWIVNNPFFVFFQYWWCWWYISTSHRHNN